MKMELWGIMVAGAALMDLAAFGTVEADMNWAQYQHDARRSGFTSEEVNPPYELAWKHCFLPERVARRVQAIIYERRVFIGTQQGNIYCFDLDTGQVLWKNEDSTSIQHSVACADRKVFLGSLDGCIYALGSETGKQLWKTQTVGPLAVAPLLAEGKVFMGNHRGVFYALDQETGDVVWQYEIHAPILNTAAYNNGKVFFGGEDIRIYALNAETGDQIWVSEQLWGMSMKDYCPVVHKGHVIVRPMTSFEAEIYTGVHGKYGSWPNSLPGGWWPVWGPGKWGVGFEERYQEAVEERSGKMPLKLLEAQEAVIQHYQEMPEDQDMFVLDAETGKTALIPPHFRVNAMHGPVTPPAEDIDGYLIVPWVHINHCWARYDITKNRLVELLIPPRPTNADENLNVSCGGKYVFIFHCEEGNANYTGVYDLREREWNSINTPGDHVTWYDNIQSGGNPASIAYGKFLHILFDTLLVKTTKEEVD